ncbi:MAG: alpha/beta fold hydrolase [Alphaproteobacteria bacterium]|nr:alpha/beta fold hydrolase [Alphaproteobacteria bacterium]
MPRVKVDKAEIYYEMHGEGPTVAMAHGGSGNTLAWFQQLPAFTKRYRVLLFDQRGWHRSPCAPDDVHPKYFADDLLAVLDREKIPKVAICGHQVGGWTALATAMQAPDRVHAIAMSASAGGVVPTGIMNAFARGPGKTVGTPAIRPSSVAPAFGKHHPERMVLFDQLARLNQDLFKPMQLLLHPDVIVKTERLKGYRTPTLVLAGQESQIIPPAALQEATAMIPGAEFKVMPGVGHSPPWEAPEAYSRHVLEFFARHVPAN